MGTPSEFSNDDDLIKKWECGAKLQSFSLLYFFFWFLVNYFLKYLFYHIGTGCGWEKTFQAVEIDNRLESREVIFAKMRKIRTPLKKVIRAACLQSIIFLFTRCRNKMSLMDWKFFAHFWFMKFTLEFTMSSAQSKAHKCKILGKFKFCLQRQIFLQVVGLTSILNENKWRRNFGDPSREKLNFWFFLTGIFAVGISQWVIA